MTDLIDDLILKEQVADVMERLLPIQQQLVEMLADGYTLDQVAEMRGVSRQAISKSCERIRKKLNKLGCF